METWIIFSLSLLCIVPVISGCILKCDIRHGCKYELNQTNVPMCSCQTDELSIKIIDILRQTNMSKCPSVRIIDIDFVEPVDAPVCSFFNVFDKTLKVYVSGNLTECTVRILLI